jgi:hypothetical protein
MLEVHSMVSGFKSSHWALATAVVASLAFAGCGKTKADSCADVVITPGGPIARECVHEVPSGALVETDGSGTSTVTLNGKVVATYPPCPCSGGPVGPGFGPPLADAAADAPDDTAEAGADTSLPTPVCHGGCLCATTAAACPAGCYRSFTAEADGGLSFNGCLNGGPLETPPDDGGLRCTYDDAGSPGTPTDFSGGCPPSGCPAGTVCVSESGGIAGGGGEYCAPIPVECHGTPTCACMGSCACRSGAGLRPERCSDQGGAITCHNGII